MALSEYPWHVGQRCAAHALATPVFQHPMVTCQGRGDVHVPPGLLFCDGLLLEDPGRWVLVVHVGIVWRERR
eukprot:2695707-Pyramimonas_sp.AAC.1